MLRKVSFLILFAASVFLKMPPEDAYIIEIPQTIDLTETRSFDIRIIQNNLKRGEILHLTLPKIFYLSDSHGKEDISGSVIGTEFSFDQNDQETKTVYLEIGEIPVGDWQGDLDIHISMESLIPSNLLESGNELNAILKTISPASIVFTGEAIEAEYIGDVSKKKDESILLYRSGDIAYITNTSDQKIIADEDMRSAFADLPNLSGVDLNHLDLSGTGDLSYLFCNDSSLASIAGISDIDTSSVTNMEHMFDSCETLTSLKISSWNTSGVGNMDSMFHYCSSLKNLSLSTWDVSSCRSFQNLFSQCFSLTSAGDLSAWDMHNAQDISGLFDGCGKLRITGNLGSWDTASIEDMSNAFNACEKLPSIGDISSWDVSAVRSFARIFANTKNLSGIGDLSGWNITSRCEDLSYMFANSGALNSSEVDLKNWNVENVTDISHMFENNGSIRTLDISGWDTSSLIDASGMFAYDQTGSLSQLQTIIGIEDLDTSSLRNISGIFYENQYLNADLSGWDTSLLEDLSYAFYGTYRFDIAKLKHWNVSSVSDMTLAFGDNAGSFIGSEIPDWYH